MTNETTCQVSDDHHYENYLELRTTNTDGFKLGNISSLNGIPFFTTRIREVTSSSGFVFGLRQFHFVDAGRNYGVFTCSFHSQKGTFGNGEVTFTWPKQGFTGFPRRMTIDTDGKLWVPLYEGGGVIQVDPRINKILRFIPIPARKVSACTFGGPDFDILYVSTMWYGHVNEHGQRQKYDAGGSVFAVKGLGVQGRPPGKYKLRVENVIFKRYIPFSIMSDIEPSHGGK
ncbi:regucalcin-like [Belonocnema kinseyi]|uniref:regucalcin-like n=1 Tax=Belonocnema kinseyi TaxID=2817044 RepID=UPI00143D67F6|nr:regucalcin-like [Belonocnema kinseyi]